MSTTLALSRVQQSLDRIVDVVASANDGIVFIENVSTLGAEVNSCTENLGGLLPLYHV